MNIRFVFLTFLASPIKSAVVAAAGLINEDSGHLAEEPEKPVVRSRDRPEQGMACSQLPPLTESSLEMK